MHILVSQVKKKQEVYLCVSGPGFKGTSVHKQTLCGQTAGGLGCGEKGGESGREKKKRKRR